MKNKYVNHVREKSLKNRIRFLVNMSILLSILAMGSLFLYMADSGIHVIKREMSIHYINEIQQILNRTLSENQVVTGEDLIRSEAFQVEMQTLTRITPILSVDMYIDQDLVYHINAEQLIISYINNELIEEEEEELDQLEMKEAFNESEVKDFQGSRETALLYDLKGDEIGYIEVGIDIRIIALIYVALVLAIAFSVILVSISMQLLTHFFTKPILKPLAKLQKQMDMLADENYDNINPSIEIGKRSVKEVEEISRSMNKLLTKMIKYNEVITQSEKMASIGQLTAAITHEINTPLGVVNSNAGLMKMLTTEVFNTIDDEERQMLLTTMSETAATTEEACQRMQEIIRSLRSFSRIDQADFMPANINESIKSVITLTTNLHKNRIKIIEQYGKIPDISCYIGLINQVFMNLIINSIQAIEKEGTITFVTSSDEHYVYAKIIDTGCGIEKKNFYRVFEYGFTTKQPGSGSGIGLALSKNIVMKHKGEILIDSEVGIGTSITVKLPIRHEKDEV